MTEERYGGTEESAVAALPAPIVRDPPVRPDATDLPGAFATVAAMAELWPMALRRSFGDQAAAREIGEDRCGNLWTGEGRVDSSLPRRDEPASVRCWPGTVQS